MVPSAPNSSTALAMAWTKKPGLRRKQPQRGQEDRKPFQRVHLHAEHPLEIRVA
jgi:hypothetical protein